MPEDTEPGEYEFDVCAYGDGVEYVCQHVVIVPVAIEKVELSGPDAVGIYTADPTPFSFQITYLNSAQDFPIRIEDTAPAEFRVTGVVASDGTAGYDWTGKPGKSATRIEWDLDAGTDCSGGCTLTVDVETKRSASGGHVYKPTSCGVLPLNDGATAYEVDPLTGDIKIVAGEPVIVVGPSNALVVDAVGDQGAGATKPCAPGDLAVELSGFNTLVLDWADNAEAVDHYNVYRGPTEDGPFTVIGEASLSEYPDTELDPGDYCYQVKAAFGPGDQDEGNESETVCENVPELPPCPCWTAEQLEATSWSYFTGLYDPSGLFRRFDLYKVPPYPARPWLVVYDHYGDPGSCVAWWADGTSTSAGPLPRSTVQACYETLSNIAEIQSVPCIDCGW